ncbi:MAG: putative lipid II flippase FtsW [Acidimicrobiia bacterium]|nr:putative lipid II flippase FtsW [Acidimicrobiia bacterium]
MASRVATIVTTRRGVREAERVAGRPTRLTVLLLIPVALLCVVGLGAILSASSVLGLRESGDGLFYFKRQAVWLGLGVIALVGAALVPLRWWRRMSFPLFASSVVLLAATHVIGTRAYGSQRWIFAGPISIQPSEIAKLTTILFLATLVSRREYSMHRLRDFLAPVVGSVGIVAALVITQPDLGTTLLVVSGAFAVLFASAAPFRFVLGSAVLSSGAALLAARTSPYRWARVTAFLDLSADPLGSGYQATQSLVALGTGGLFGVGLGASRARWSFLPNAHTDFIFSIIGEETGLAGSLAVLLLMVALTAAGGAIAYYAQDRFGRLLAIGITTWLVAQALVNLGGVTGVLPITGVPLPFVSFGGSALVTAMVAVGVLISVARHRVPIDSDEEVVAW